MAPQGNLPTHMDQSTYRRHLHLTQLLGMQLGTPPMETGRITLPTTQDHITKTHPETSMVISYHDIK